MVRQLDLSKGRLIIDLTVVDRFISRIAYEILEKDRNVEKLALVGIRTGGEFFAERLRDKIKELEGKEPHFGVVDITLYRDDLLENDNRPLVKGTSLPFKVSGTRIVLVDDVLYTGRTIRSALDAIIDFGRPQRVELAVLIDRGHRELPIRPDYIGKNLPTNQGEKIRVYLGGEGESEAELGVYLFEKGTK